jgi:hypothetical protein
VFATPRAIVLACAATVGLVAGCGAQEHANDPRPQPPTRVSVAINQEEVIVDPARIAVGPEPDQQIPQNQNTSQPQIRSDAPLDVALVAANLTDLDSRLQVRGNGQDASTQMLVANGNISLQTALPTGVYTVSAADIPSAEPARLVVGPFRTSSENDVLLP